MNIMSVALVPIALMFSTNLIAQAKQQKLPEDLDEHSVDECSEVILEFKIGGLVHEIESASCSSISETINQSKLLGAS